MSRNVTIASLKAQAALWDAEENLRRLEPLVRQAAVKGADIIRRQLNVIYVNTIDCDNSVAGKTPRRDV